MRTCPHSRGRWVETKSMYPNGDTGEFDITREWQEFSTYEDIDLHRVKCSQCGHINYYSGAARQFYEEGKRSPGITGLE